MLIVFSLFLALTTISSPERYFARTMNSLGHRLCTAGVVWRLDAALAAVIWSCGGDPEGVEWGGPTGGGVGGTHCVWGGPWGDLCCCCSSLVRWECQPGSLGNHPPFHQQSFPPPPQIFILQTLKSISKMKSPSKFLFFNLTGQGRLNFLYQ